MSSTANPPADGPRLRRSLTLWDLILYGIIVIQPVAPMSVFGVLSNRGHGHVVTTIMVAMVAMLFTAISYGRMARAYPSAGSAFTYVGQEINPALGYVTGWSMVMDYMLNPIICTIWCSQQAHVFAPGVPYWAWAVFFALVFTLLNIQGVKTSARVNSALAAGMGVVIAIFFVVAARYVFGHPHGGAGFYTRPFYDPALWNTKAVLGGTSIAVLTYIGFDGISTLSEEAENPRRNILLATVLTCLVIGILSAVEVYAAQLIWPASQPFPDVDTAFVHVAAAAPGSRCLASSDSPCWSPTSDRAWARRSAPPACSTGWEEATRFRNRFSGWSTPSIESRNNVLFVGAIALIGAFVMSYGLGAEMLNFGALIAFMGVNAAAFMRYVVRDRKGRCRLSATRPWLRDLLSALAEPEHSAKIAGSIWMAAGIAFGAWKTRGFRGDLVNFDLPAEE